jgi:hypothetical protein
MHQTIFVVPAIIVACNVNMNSVDRIDQKRATNLTRRKHQMSLLAYFWTAAPVAYPVFQCTCPHETMSFL